MISGRVDLNVDLTVYLIALNFLGNRKGRAMICLFMRFIACNSHIKLAAKSFFAFHNSYKITFLPRCANCLFQTNQRATFYAQTRQFGGSLRSCLDPLVFNQYSDVEFKKVHLGFREKNIKQNKKNRSTNLNKPFKNPNTTISNAVATHTFFRCYMKNVCVV